eukprot:TRINITY_DN8786_c0_g1_i1.p1 TRINITY_DN8786_c0_g1~~TRINITY_DN8786_c0_g1_i1.p1  ORF type:complete len:710 (+),score=142.99 TRINITY_DN8786_c0_g1_i1:64-2193(+)
MRLLMRQFFLVLYLAFAAAHYDSDDEFFFGNRPFPVISRIYVHLLGFDDDADNADLSRFQKLLDTSYPVHTLHSLEQGKQLNVEFHLAFEIQKFPVDQYENHLANVLSPEKNKLSHSAHYEVQVEGEIAKYFDDFITRDTTDSYAIFIVNPSKQRLAQRIGGRGEPPKPFNYSLTYGESIPGQAWISGRRYIVVDLAAGPIAYGGTSTNDGVITSQSIVKGNRTPIELEGQLAALIISAVRYVFFPDIQFSDLPHSDKILIPIVILRNHIIFNPLEGDSDFSIDFNYIRKQVQQMFLPHQSVTVVAGVHSLHDHKHLSMAVSKAKRSDSVHELTWQGRYVAREKVYLDSNALIHEFRKVEDLLGSGLLSLSTPAQNAFFNQRVPDLDELEDLSTTSPSIEDSEKSDRSKSQNTKVLPVYVLSLVAHEEGLLLDQNFLSVATKEAVVVLQTDEPSVETTFFSGDQHLSIYPRQATRQIIAGISKAIGGLVDPSQHYSSLHKRVVKDYFWALGHHPFGHFSNFTGVSQLHRDAILRNNIVTRMDSSIATIKKAISQVDRFAKEFLYNPFVEDVSHNESHWKNFVDDLFHNPIPDSVSPIAAATVFQLHQQLKKLQKQMEATVQLIYDNKLEEAYRRTYTFERTATAFKQYVHNEIEESESELLCCALRTDVKSTTSSSLYLWLILSLVVVFTATRFVLSPSTLSKASKTRS